ncbi:MAG: hypothetical protein IH597_15350 [Bacteroidales bacterium]|nr:hypothetical protein [Bacteroidales bacterium]
MENQFDDEREILQLFRKSWPAFPKGRLIKTESPDFILKTSRKNSIGIEITRIDTPTSGKHFNSSETNNSLSKSISGAETTQFITGKFLESTIERKEQKLSLYRKQMSDAYWLIITTKSSNWEGSRLPQSIHEWNFETKFDKLFLFMLPECKVFVFK